MMMSASVAGQQLQPLVVDAVVALGASSALHEYQENDE
jgi:hypothetical protein